MLGADNSCNNRVNHDNSDVILLMLLYSASTEEQAIVVCFFIFQDINEAPRKIQYPVMDLLVSIQVAQLASQ